MNNTFYKDFPRDRLPLTMMLMALLVTATTACKQDPVEVVEPLARPVKSMLVGSPQGAGVRRFPGRVDSANKALGKRRRRQVAIKAIFGNS